MTYDASSVGECHKCVYMCLYSVVKNERQADRHC